MNRWLGNAAQSSRQASERNQRQAKRTIAQQKETYKSDSDPEFEDANTSFSAGLNLDGNDDQDIMADAAARLAAEKAKPVDTANFQDDDEAWKKEIKIKFDKSDISYWFNSVEAQMKKYGINSQWSKKDAIAALLPEDVLEECKPILRLQEADAGPAIYKKLKTELLDLYGPRDEDVFKKAIALRLGNDRPSALGKRLIHIICPGAKPMDGCHCSKIIFGFWEAQMPPSIKISLADKKFTKDTYSEIFKHADKVWEKNGGAAAPAVVAATAVQATGQNPSPSPDSAQVAAVSRGGARGGRGNRGGRGGRGGGGRGANNSNSNSSSNTSNRQNQSSSSGQTQGQKPHQRGPRHSPDVPDSACARHWKEGRNATYCSDPLVCGWVHIIAPRKS